MVILACDWAGSQISPRGGEDSELRDGRLHGGDEDAGGVLLADPRGPEGKKTKLAGPGKGDGLSEGRGQPKPPQPCKSA